MVSIGEQGYLDAARRILETAAKIKKGIAEIPELYVIGDGAVEILMNPSLVAARQEEDVESVIVAELLPGQVFGEVSLVDQGIRSATVRVNRDKTYVLRLARERLMLLCDTYPELGYVLMKNLAADLALKLRNADLQIRQYQLMLSRPGASES